MDTRTLKQRIIFRRIIQILVVVAIFLMAITDINHENDIFWQLKMGEDIIRYHFFPTLDIYSSTAKGAIWTLHEWIPSVLFYLVNLHFGSAGLIISKAILVAITFSLFLLLFNKLKINLYVSLVIFVLAALVNSRGVWVVFPSIFEYLFLVITLYALEIYKKENAAKISIFLSVFSLLWANSHASFFLLPITIGAFVVGKLISNFLSKKYKWYKPLESNHLTWNELKFLIYPFIISLFTPFMTPSGYWTWLYPFRISLGKFTSYVSEYQHFWQVWTWNWADFVDGFSFILMILVWIIFWLAKKHLHLYDLFLGVIFTGLALSAARHLAIFALVALFLIARYTKVWMGEYRGIIARSLLKDILVIVLIVCATFFYKTRVVNFGFALSEDGYPKTAAELINGSGISGNMFNHYNYGGYLIWKMPKYPVFIDGRLEMYLNGVGEDYETIISGGPGYQLLIDKYKINFFLVYLTDPIVMDLVNDPNWKYVYHDSQYVVFVKDAPQNQSFLSKYWSKNNNNAFDAAYTIARNQFLAEYYNSLGIDSLKSGKLMDATNAFQMAVGFEPNYLIGHINLARAYIEIGTYTEAEKEYKEILTIDPTNSQAKTNLNQIENILKSGATYRAQIW